MKTRLIKGAALLVYGAVLVMPFSACSSNDAKSTSCVTGEEKCACFANNTCLGDLSCLSDVCVSLAGAGGNTSSAPSTIGGASTSPITGSGGSSDANTATGGSTNTTTGGANTTTGGANTASGGANTASGGANTASGGSGTAKGGTSSISGGATSTAYIIQTNGWAVEPTHGIAGPIYTFTDPGGSNIFPACPSNATTLATCFEGTSATSQFCVSGTTARALTSDGFDCELTSASCDWTSYWGAALAINLNQAADSTTPSAWDASTYTGITFTASVAAMPVNLRLYINLIDGTQYCSAITASKTYTLTWGQFLTNCHTTGGTPLSGVALKQIRNFAWQAGTNASLAKPYDFCISNVRIN